MNNEHLLALLPFATTTSALEAIVAQLDLKTLHTSDLVRVRTTVFLGEAMVISLWKKGKTNATTSSLAAMLCDSPLLLSQMAQMDSRIKVRGVVARNSLLPLADLAALSQALGVQEVPPALVYRRVHAEPLTPMLRGLCDTRPLRAAFVSHPSHTTESLVELLDVSSPHLWEGLVAAREDLPFLPDVLRLLFSPLRTHRQRTLEVLARRTDLQKFSEVFLRGLVRAGFLLEVAALPDLSQETLDLLFEYSSLVRQKAPEWVRYQILESLWMVLAQNAGVPSSFLAQAPLKVGLGPLGRLLKESHPGDSARWELACSLMGSGADLNVGEFLESLTALAN